MQLVKSVKCIILVALAGNFLLYGMSDDKGNTFPGIPRGPYVPGLPPISGEAQVNAAVTQVLGDIAQSWLKKQEDTEKGQEESLELSKKRRKIEKEEDAFEQSQSAGAQHLSSMTTITPPTSTQLLRRPSAPVWEESEWADVLQAMNQRIDREYAEEQFHGLLPEIEDTLLRRDTNLINLIAERFFEREITLDELNAATISRSPYTVRLIVRAGSDQPITQEQIRLIGQMFPNLRELQLSGVGLTGEGFRTLSKQKIARNLTRLDVSRSQITVFGLIGAINNFINLRSLNIAFSLIGGVGLNILAQAPFAGNLTELNIGMNSLADTSIQANIGAFTSLRSLNIESNYIGSAGLAIIAGTPFAGNLAEFNVRLNRITSQDMKANIPAFTSLTSLDIGANNIQDEGLEAIAQAPCAPHLIELNVGMTGITTEGVQANIAAFTSLTSLNIGNNWIGDAGLAALAQAPFARNLTKLNIAETGITNMGIADNIQAFTSLAYLNIALNRFVGEEGIAAISQLPFALQFTRDVANTSIK